MQSNAVPQELALAVLDSNNKTRSPCQKLVDAKKHSFGYGSQWQPPKGMSMVKATVLRTWSNLHL